MLKLNSGSKILLTTTDYLPQLGGLTTFTLNIEKSLQAMGLSYDLFHYEKGKKNEISNIPASKYLYVINVHFLPGTMLKSVTGKVINFYHGSEILFYSPNILKRLAKKLIKRKLLRYFESTHLNCFISQFTFEKLVSKGMSSDFSRDLIIPNAIELNPHLQGHAVSINDDVIQLICVARDVPHKNMNDAVIFAENLQAVTGKNIVLYITAEDRWGPSSISIQSIEGISDERREELFASSHFNLLFSLDHSHKGFYEGFGLTVLEASKYGTPTIAFPSGGLRESVHDGVTGWHMKVVSKDAVGKLWFDITNGDYSQMRNRCKDHTSGSHGLDHYEKFFKSIMEDL